MQIERYLLLTSLNEDSVGLKFFNKLLRTLSKHGRLVHGANEVDFLTIEAFSQVDKGCLEAVLSIRNRLIHTIQIRSF